MELVMKNGMSQPAPAARFSPRTPEELEEQRRFEEQKRALEERAERLRKMSFNLHGNESANELEQVPAYIRKKIDLDEAQSPADYGYSGYSVEGPKHAGDKGGHISTINTFLDGKKPD